MRSESREFAYVLMERVGRPRHVVEVGAFKSEHILCCPFVFDPQCRIQLFKPNPACVRELHAAYAEFSKIEIHEYAAADTTGELTLMIPKILESNPHADASAFVGGLPGSPYHNHARETIRSIRRACPYNRQGRNL